METKQEKKTRFYESITAKVIVIGVLTLLMLIPTAMVSDLIQERNSYSNKVKNEINDKWSLDQTVTGPVLTIPYSYTYTENKKTYTEYHKLHVFPEELYIKSNLKPEERYIGIYKSILYQSDLKISGHFKKPDFSNFAYTKIDWDKAYVTIGISDLRGIKNNIDLTINGKSFSAEPGGKDDEFVDNGLKIKLNDHSVFSGEVIEFNSDIKLNGSSSIFFIPVGKTTKVELSGIWSSPSFKGAFTPESKVGEDSFKANWNVLHYNRNIPQKFVDNEVKSSGLDKFSFGVNLLETVGMYQKNMRSAKYALMFIVLTFVVFFFVEIFTKKKIHPVQYLLVAIALVLFYSLLLSISEQLNFDWAYLIAAFSTVILITSYGYSIFKKGLPTFALGFILSVLYIFLYVILQLEDLALLMGSIGLFVVLGIIMYFTKKINWYKPTETIKESNK